jgi:hypothetical protein
VQFQMLARGAFTVRSSQRGGKVEFVELHSQRGGACQLTNPWDAAEVTVYRDGRSAETLVGTQLEFATQKGETVTIVPQGSPLVRLKVQR